MASIIPVAIIGAVLVAIALLVWRREKREKPGRIGNGQKRAFFAQWITGIVLALIAAASMFDGDILGDRNTGISTILWIAGISLIATSNVNLLSLKRNKAD
jgi:Na+/proline symporter